MRRKEIVLQPPDHAFADGAVMTHEELMSKKQVFPYDKNAEVIDTYARTVDPKFRALEVAKRRFERTEKRRQELVAQQQCIKNELAKL